MKLPKIGKNGRVIFCILLLAVFFLLYEVRLFQWQIIDGEKYQEQSLKNRTDVIELDAARGEIRDRNGKLLDGNRTSYDVVYNALNMVREERNATIIKVLDLLEEQGDEWEDWLPIELDQEGGYRFKEDAESEITTLKSKDMLNLADYATAQDCMDSLADWFGCRGYSAKDTRNVASVRYGMVRNGFSRTNPYVIAKDLSADTVGILSQRAAEWPGVEIRVSVARYYGDDGALAPHVVGYTGAIQDWQLEDAESSGKLYDSETNLSGYKLNDTVGRSGLELAFESDLRGQRGEATILLDDNGDMQDLVVTTQPQEGNTVYTTLDSDLQRAANLSLEKNILANTQAKNCTAGAVVALDVKDFGVLVSASYPTYDLNLYTSDTEYNVALNGDNDKKPLFDRALTGVFTPGSVFKPMVALAALQEKSLSAGHSAYCPGTYKLGNDPGTALEMKCLCGGGTWDVYGALAKSCNSFFSNVGMSLTIKKMDAYAEYFGLGEKTGVEIYEASGEMSSPSGYAINHPGDVWLDGMTAQTAIGQADNQFTPVQLATYCATIANNGKRLQTHFLQKVTDYTGENTLREFQAVEVRDAGLSADVLGVVKQGMMGVASWGTAKTVFSDYPVSVACKTGTAETSQDGSKEPNLSFICYAPAEDPEIAIAVVMEYGNEGDYAKLVAKDILDQYFGFHTWDEEGNRYNQRGDLVDDEDKVLKTREELEEERKAKERQEQQDFLSSAPESSGGDNAASDPEPTPEPSSAPGRGDDIPTTPFTGESSNGPESSGSSAAPGEDSSRPPPDSPYYTGKASTSSG